jgi:hypothetical protein
MALGEIEGSELSSANASTADGLEDATGTFTLVSDLETEVVRLVSTSQSADIVNCFDMHATTTAIDRKSCNRSSRFLRWESVTYNATHLVFPCAAWKLEMGSCSK